MVRHIHWAELRKGKHEPGTDEARLENVNQRQETPAACRTGVWYMNGQAGSGTWAWSAAGGEQLLGSATAPRRHQEVCQCPM